MVPGIWKKLVVKDLQDLYSKGNQIHIQNWFFNNAMDGGGRKEAKVFTEKKVNQEGE